MARTAEAASTAGGGPLIVSALIVRGETVDEKDERVDLGHDAQILVAVIHVGHLTNRADLKVEEPVNNPWVAKTGSHHFNENDEVYAVGAATQKAADRPRAPLRRRVYRQPQVIGRHMHEPIGDA